MEDDRLYRYLVQIARFSRRRVRPIIITYTEAGAILGIRPYDPHLFDHLDNINEFERDHGRPMLSALVVNKQSGMPGRGFFRLARSWGLDTSNPNRFWRRELKRVSKHWRRRP